jgi:hypothetical protein
MAELEPVFAPGSYVVRYGRRGVLGTLAGLLVAIAVTTWTFASGRPVLTDLVCLAFDAGLLIALGTDLSRAARREIQFAVHQGGVYFGSDRIKDDVPWSRISAVEFFRESTPGTRTTTVHRCVGVRSPGTEQPRRPGNGAAAQPVPERSLAFMLDAGRPDLLPGYDATIRYAYRRMSGWRADPARVAEAVARYAPAISVIKGQDWPAAITRADAYTARRVRRSR